MSTNYPTNIDSFPIHQDNVNETIAAATINNIQDSIVAVETFAKAMPTNYISRQGIINGNFDVWQRGISFSNPGTSAYTSDRFRVSLTNTGTLPVTLTHSRQNLTSGDISNAYYFYRLQTDGAGSGFGANDQYGIQQLIEQGNRFLAGAGKKVALSFWARSSIANKKLGIRLIQNYGTGGTPSASETLTGTKYTLTSTWTKYTFTFSTNTLVGKTFGSNNDDYLAIEFGFMYGSTFASFYGDTITETFVGAGTIDIAQVQVNAGDQALPFQPRSFAEELQLCKRYYQKSFPYSTVPAQNSGTGQGALVSTQTVAASTVQSALYGYVRHPVPMRTQASVTTYNPNAANNQVRNTVIGVDCTSTMIVDSSDQGFRVDATTPAGSATSQLLMLHYTADAEL